MFDLNRCFKRNSTILYKELDNGPVLIDPYRRTLVKLNETALEVWQLLDGARSVLGIMKELRERYEIDEAALKKDVTDFLNELAKREMIG